MAKIFSIFDPTASQIQAGELPSPAVLNRPMLGLNNVDSAIDEALQYEIRSTKLYATDKTQSLFRFASSGADSIGTVRPTKSHANSEIFVYDGVFQGSAFIQSAAQNLISREALVDSTMKSLSGWAMTSTGDPKHTVLASTNGTTISNVLAVETDPPTAITPGTVTLASLPIPTTDLTKISMSISVENNRDLDYEGAVIQAGVIFVDAGGAEMSRVYAQTNASIFNGRLTLENQDVPVAPNMKAFVSVTFLKATTEVSAVFSNFMINEGAISHTFNVGLRTATTLAYADAVNTSDDSGTILAWAQWKTNWLPIHAHAIGPVFLLANTDAYAIGVVHDNTSGATLDLSLIKAIKQGDGSWSKTTLGTMSLDAANKELYLLHALRYNKTTAKVEYAIIDKDYAVNKISADIPEDFPTGRQAISLGYAGTWTDLFNGGVGELRYDNEWLNDYELLTLAINQQGTFTADEAEGSSAGGGITFPELQEYLDNLPMNLIKNPDGRLHLNHWKGYDANFAPISNDINTGFIWSGTAGTDLVLVESELIPVTSGTKIMYRGIMSAATGTTEGYGMAIKFYDVDKTTMIGTLIQTPGVSGVDPDYYEISVESPATAVYVAACLYVNANATSDGAFWSKLKLAFSDQGTMFSDELSPKFAVYA